MNIVRRIFPVLAFLAACFSSASVRAQNDLDEMVPVKPPRPAPNSWLTYKGDLQRTGAVSARLGAAPNLMWRHSSDLAPKSFDTTPLVAGPPSQRRIYFAMDRHVVCIDAQTGAQVWRSKPLQRPIASPITMISGEVGDLILAVTSSGQLNALRTSDGGQVWQVASAAPVQNVAPVVVRTPEGERIILALSTGRLIAFTMQGQPDPAWEVRLGGSGATPTATPAISPDGSLLYISTQDKKLYVVDIAAAKISFPIALDFGAYSSPLIIGDRLVIATGTTLVGMRLATGVTQWRFDVKSTLTAPAAKSLNQEGVIYVGARNNKFYALRAENGGRIWETDLGNPATSTPIVLDDVVLVGTRSGILFGLAPDTGKILWRYRLHSQRLMVERDRDDERGGIDGDDRGDRRGRSGAVPAPTGFGGIGAALGEGGATGGEGVGEARYFVQNFGISTTPAVVGNAIYVLADSAALYAFSTQPFDADPPQVVNPQLSIPNSANRPSLMNLDPDKPLLVPGRAPIQLLLEITDAGSGVDPDSIRVSLNKQELPSSAIAPFADATGRLLVTLAEQKGRVTATLDDGLFVVAVTARDYRGNEMNYATNILVDNTIPPPAAPVVDDEDERER